MYDNFFIYFFIREVGWFLNHLKIICALKVLKSIDSGASLSLVTNRLVQQVNAPKHCRITALSGIQGVSVPDSQFIADLE